MALDNFIPEVWSAEILETMKTALVFGALANRDYEGEITGAGDTVRINSIGTVSIKDYDRSAGIDAPEALDGAQTVLLIDQEKYFNFSVADLDRIQGNADQRGAAVRESAYRLQKVMDSYLASLYAGIASANKITNAGAAITPTSSTAYDYLVDLATKLDEADVPDDGQRWAIVTPAFYGLLLKDSRFVADGSAAGAETRANGRVGEAAGLTIHKSTQVHTPSGSNRLIVAGHPSALSVAQQVVSVEAFRPERDFADAVKGLHVYGAKMVRPSCAATLLSTL
jgi:P22 coat protein - gene protein 5.